MNILNKIFEWFRAQEAKHKYVPVAVVTFFAGQTVNGEVLTLRSEKERASSTCFKYILLQDGFNRRQLKSVGKSMKDYAICCADLEVWLAGGPVPTEHPGQYFFVEKV